MGVSEGTGAAMATANEMGRAVSRRARPIAGGERFPAAAS